jgi:hypothetical protein
MRAASASSVRRRLGGVDLVDGAADHVVVVFLVIGHGQM